ncbi:site-specific integrase, partial [Candidatus Bathyarchaeota archaeon]|nr:site-specific integrase [Candidatus Bathyarchaeota archaeon]
QGPLDNQAIYAVISELIEKAGLDGNNGFKPTSLRDALEDALVEANINHKLIETIMGHTCNIEHEYGGMNKLIVNVVEAMKKAYPLLTLNGLTRVSTGQQVSKEELEAIKTENTDLKRRIQQTEERMVNIEKMVKELKESL